MGMGLGGSEELVMPLLNVSQSTGPRWTPATTSSPWTRSHGGIKVVILGTTVRTYEFIRELKEIKEVIELKQGEYGIIGGDQVIATLSTGLTSDDVRSIQYTSLTYWTFDTWWDLGTGTDVLGGESDRSCVHCA